ncbi:MAG: hypothetical protein ACI8PZ_005067 [Myxococcota bacterium]|jgi:hypothetical protein
MCNSGTAFRARVDGRRLSFEEMGIYNGVFVMRDHQTGSIWAHYTGEAVEGPLKGSRLEWLPLERFTKAGLLAAHPDAGVPPNSALRFRKTQVPLTKRATELGEFLPDNFVPTLQADGLARLPRHTHGLGVAVRDAHRFYPLDGLTQPVHDKVGGVDIVVLLHDGSASAAAYSRCIDGESLAFTGTEHAGRSALRSADGTVWDATGAAVAGPRAKAQLTSVRSLITDWYGWGANFPATTIHGSK